MLVEVLKYLGYLYFIGLLKCLRNPSLLDLGFLRRFFFRKIFLRFTSFRTHFSFTLDVIGINKVIDTYGLPKLNQQKNNLNRSIISSETEL